MQGLKYFTFLMAVIGLFSFNLTAQTTPAVTLQPFLTGFSSPVFLTNAKDGTNRIFVVQQGGIIKVVQPGSNAVSDFINISTKLNAGGEQGLLGLTFHPQFASNGYFFLNYTRAGDGATIIARYKTTDATNALGDSSSERILLTIPQPFSNHNGGTIEFGPDGFLYIGMGDGGSANDPDNRAQNPAQLLGKMLRIDVDVPNSSTVPYLIPPTNPFTGTNTARCDGMPPPGSTCQEIWTLGMRNPFRWSFDRGGTRQLWAGDVGQGAREEVDIITRGGNFGWRIVEGNICNPGINTNCTLGNYIAPVFDYTHAGGRCSITGGYVYRGTQATLPGGAYVYGDYCTGEILMWNNNQQTLLIDSPRNISSFGENEAGEIFVVGLGGTVEKLTSLNPTAAGVTITGRAMTAKGRGIGSVVIKLTDAEGNIRTATTSAFGYYRFDDVAAGATYVISATSKRYGFNQPAQSLSLSGDTEEVNFIANF